tara:strand:- start:405 stop:539 length:135 start_codon:yes stop_codon:yes gene_type:complete
MIDRSITKDLNKIGTHDVPTNSGEINNIAREDNILQDLIRAMEA